MMINSNQNMEWSHIINECNDGRENDLGEDCSSLILKTNKVNMKNEGYWKAHIRTLTNKHTQ